MTIAIAILTYRRPEAILATLRSIAESDPVPLQNCIIQIVDNDPEASAKAAIHDFQQNHTLKIFYTHEPNRGIANARNRAMDEVFNIHHCQWLAFLDDDEIVEPDWLSKLLTYQFKYQCDVVMGNVIFDLPDLTPDYIRRSAYFDRERPKSGDKIHTAFTGNVLISKKIYDDGLRFDPRFNLSGGEDHHFFSQANESGFKMIYCGESLTYSPVQKDRTTVKWLLKRAEISAMAGAISDKIILGLPQAIAKNITHICYRFSLGCWRMVQSVFQPNIHWSHALRHIMIAKGRFKGLIKTKATPLY